MNEARVEDRLADFTRDRRILILSLMAVVIGALSAVVADALVWLIAVITNLAFYQQFSAVFQSPEHHHLGYLIIVVPVAGGLLIGLIAESGSAEAAVLSHLDRLRRPLRRGRPDHHDGRGGRLALRAILSPLIG